MKDLRIEKAAEILKAVAESLKDVEEKIVTIADLLVGIAQEQEAAEQGTLFLSEEDVDILTHPKKRRRRECVYGYRRWNDARENKLVLKYYKAGLPTIEICNRLKAAGYKRTPDAVDNFIKRLRTAVTQ